MIPPSLLNVTYYFSLLPVWEQEPVPTEQSQTPAAADGSGTNEANAQPSGQPGADADGVNDQVAMRMVLKGYKLSATPQWEAQANAGYEQWIEDRGDEDAERHRQDQRARGARPNPHPTATGPEAASAPPASDCSE